MSHNLLSGIPPGFRISILELLMHWPLKFNGINTISYKFINSCFCFLNMIEYDDWLYKYQLCFNLFTHVSLPRPVSIGVIHYNLKKDTDTVRCIFETFKGENVVLWIANMLFIYKEKYVENKCENAFRSFWRWDFLLSLWFDINCDNM